MRGDWILGRLAVLLALLALAAPTGAAAAELSEVAACLRANLPGSSSIVMLELRSIDRSGGARTLSGQMHWKQNEQGLSKTLIELEMPLDVRGSAYLVLERESGQDMWVYLPGLAKVRRIHPRTISGQLFGTDFSYEDIARLQRISTDQSAERLPDEKLGERSVYRLRAVPGEDEGSAYSRIDYFLDRETCLPLKIEFYALDGALRKLLTGETASIQRAGAGWILGSVQIQDLGSGTESQLVLSNVQIDVDLPDRMFQTSYLVRGH
jgi:outer membrane lipoprotein-sorting protein